MKKKTYLEKQHSKKKESELWNGKLRRLQKDDIYQNENRKTRINEVSVWIQRKYA